VLTAETLQMLGPIEVVTVKTAFSRSAAATMSFPARSVNCVQPRAGGPQGQAGQYPPLVLERPYNVRFCLRRNYAEDDWVRETVDGSMASVRMAARMLCLHDGLGEAVGNLLNLVEWTVLKP